jgi:cytochrome c-type biogenesis protein CcmF
MFIGDVSLGDILIKLSALCALIATVTAIRWARGHAPSERMFRVAYHAMSATLVLASALLMIGIFRHDFRIDYIVGYSSRDLPVLYLFSAFWAGQQGTYLLWALFGALLGYPLIRKNSWEPAAVMAFYVPTVGFMHMLMLDPGGNPFRLSTVVPPDGRGLNPLLQDPWMASHPPAVFLGYVAATIPAVLAMVALVKKREDKWVNSALRWSLMSFITLGIGIVLGAFWAYKVLGWGGYWGWDPVENASLVPWIVVTALVHGLLVQKGTGALPKTNLALALASYVTVFYATFLTRSGVLADFSVHSFPAGTIFRLLLGIQLLILAVSLILLFRRWSVKTRPIPMQLSWPLILTSVVVLFVVSGGMVLIGMSWPIITSWLGKPAAFGPSWYNTVSTPVYIGLLALLGIAPFLAWTTRPSSIVSTRVVISASFAAVGTTVAMMLGARGGIALILLFVSLTALVSNLMRLVEVGRVRMLNTGAALAHVGFALMFLGIIGSSFWGIKQEARLPQGQPVEVMGRSYTFLGHVDGSEPKDRWAIQVQPEGGRPYTVEVGMFRTSSRQDAQIMHQPAIKRGLAGDLYIAPGGIEEAGGHHDVVLTQGEATPFGDVTLTFLQFDTHSMDQSEGISVYAQVEIDNGSQKEILRLPFGMVSGQYQADPIRPTIQAGITTLQLQKLSVEQKQILVHADTPTDQVAQILGVEISTKPLMNLLWFGTLLLGVGCTVAWARRVVDERAMARALAGSSAPPQSGSKTEKKAGRRSAQRPAHAR